MKIIKTKKYAQSNDPFSVDFELEKMKAKQKPTPELFNALKDAIEASQVSPNAGKYTDQASVYRRELENRGIDIAEQDRTLAMLPGLHSKYSRLKQNREEDFSDERDFSGDYDPYAGTGWDGPEDY